jgi:O-antigen ligase
MRQAAALRMFASNPALGLGPGGYGEALDHFTSTHERARAYPPLGTRRWTSHSFWLRWAAEGGALGLIAWLVLHAVVLRLLLREGATGSRMACALCGLMLDGLHVDYGDLKFVWAALAIALCEPRREDRGQSVAPPPAHE